MKTWKYILGTFLLATVCIWLAVFVSPDKNLHLIACNVGEGDAILATYKNIQILTDGGPDNRVLDCLAKYMPFFDHEIELVVLTHPDSDHYRGLIEVLKRYKVDNFLYNDLKVSSSDYGVLEKEVGGRGMNLLYPKEGMKIRVGKIYLDILRPEGELITSKEELKTGKIVAEGKTNDYSIVDLVSFGNFKALLTGDMTPQVSDSLASRQLNSPINYIKVPHHGSRNGLTKNLLEAVRPTFAIISVGKNNYGHPDEGILKILKDRNIKILRTDEMGDVEVVSDGKRYWPVGL